MVVRFNYTWDGNFAAPPWRSHTVWSKRNVMQIRKSSLHAPFSIFTVAKTRITECISDLLHLPDPSFSLSAKFLGEAGNDGACSAISET